MNSRKVKVLLVVRWPVGGIRTFMRYVYHYFDQDKWHLTIIAPDLPEMRVLIVDLVGLGVDYIFVEQHPSPFGFYRKVAMEIICGGYDLIHSHGFTSGMGAALPATIRRTPHVMTSHDVLKKEQFKGFKGIGMLLGMSVLLRLINVVHSVSCDAQQNLLEFFPFLSRQESKCITISNGIEVERFVEAEPRNLKNELGLSDDIFLIGFFGRFMSQKGFGYLVDAVEIILSENGLTKHPLVLCFGAGGFIREEKQAIKARNLEDSFRFMPFTPNVAGTIKGLDVVAMPSLWEACPLLPMEVLVCGVPFVGSDCAGLREVIRGTPAISVPKADAASLARALVKEMDVSTEKLFIDFSGTAAKLFDAKKTRQSLQDMYQKMALRTAEIYD